MPSPLPQKPASSMREQHGDRVAVVDLHHVDVGAGRARPSRTPTARPRPDRRVGQVGRVGRRLVREVLAEAGDGDRAVGALAPARRATTTAAPPVHGITISSMRSGSAITGDASTSSRVRGWPKKTASGLAHALRRAGRPRSWPAPARPSRTGRGSAGRTSRSRSSGPTLPYGISNSACGEPHARSTRRRRMRSSSGRGTGRRRARARRRWRTPRPRTCRARWPRRPATPCRPARRRRGRAARRSSPTSRSTRRRSPAGTRGLGMSSPATSPSTSRVDAGVARASAARSAHCSRVSFRSPPNCRSDRRSA